MYIFNLTAVMIIVALFKKLFKVTRKENKKTFLTYSVLLLINAMRNVFLNDLQTTNKKKRKNK